MPLRVRLRYVIVGQTFSLPDLQVEDTIYKNAG